MSGVHELKFKSYGNRAVWNRLKNTTHFGKWLPFSATNSRRTSLTLFVDAALSTKGMKSRKSHAKTGRIWFELS